MGVRVTNNARKVGGRIKSAASGGAERAGEIWVEAIQDKFVERGTPSLPGESPTNQTGTTRAGYTAKKVDDYRVEVSSNTATGVFLERGTTRMAPRPHVRPAYEENRSRIRQAVEQEFRELS